MSNRQSLDLRHGRQGGRVVPWTSKEAERRNIAEQRADQRTRIRAILAQADGLTHHEISQLAGMSDLSSARTRVSELVKDGEAAEVVSRWGLSPSGRRAKLWILTPLGHYEHRQWERDQQKASDKAAKEAKRLAAPAEEQPGLF